MCASMDEEKVVGMDRSGLLEAVAKTITEEQLEEAAQLTSPTDEYGSVASEAGSEALRMRELEMEEKRCVREERKAEREAEERKAEREAEERRGERELQRELKRMELEQAKLALEMRKIEVQALTADPGDAEGSEDGNEPTLRAQRGDNTLATQTKRFGDIMKHVLPKMPTENSELPQFLRQ